MEVERTWNNNFSGINVVDLIIVCSITDEIFFNGEHGFAQCLKFVGIPYLFISTNPTLTLSQSYNSIVKTNYEDVKNSKYVTFVSQDSPIREIDWGRKLIDICDSLPDFGYGGLVCVKENCGFIKTTLPSKCESCDAFFIVIPSKLFLENQFDEQFPWYPFAETIWKE